MLLISEKEFEILRNELLNEAVMIKVGKSDITIDPPRKAQGTDAVRKNYHDNRIKASITGNTKDHNHTTSVPLFYGEGRDEYGDLIIEDIQYGKELSKKQREDTEKAIIAVYNYAKKEIKEFIDTDNIEPLKKKLKRFNDLKDKEKYYEL